MPLRIEFADRDLTIDEVTDFLVEEEFRLREQIQRQTSGRLGVYLFWAKLPNYLDQAIEFPEDWEPRFFFTDKLYDLCLEQGIYGVGEGKTKVKLIVQTSKDRDVRALCHEVEAQGTDLASLSAAFLRLLSGELEPSFRYVTTKRCGSLKVLPSSFDDQDRGEEKDGTLFLEDDEEEKTAAA